METQKMDSYVRQQKEKHRHRQSRSKSEHRGQHKKKKRHRDQRPSESENQRKEKKHKRKHSRSDSPSKKHKKHHKEGKQRKQRERSRSQRREKKHKHHRSTSKDRRDRHESKNKRDENGRRHDRDQQGRRRDDRRDDSRRRDQKKRLDEQSKQQIRKERTPERRESPLPERKSRNLDSVDPYFEERRQIERIRREGNTEKADKLQEDLQRQMVFDAKERQYEQMKEKFKQTQKQMEEAKRQDHTILVYCLPLKAKEKDIWNFFNKAECGRIRDIRIIRDQRSGKSKGVAYVQFYVSDSVEKALTMKPLPIEVKGRQFTGLRIQHSQAEKNRAAAVAKQMRVTRQPNPFEQEKQIVKRQTKVQVRGLNDKLESIQESQLKYLFDPFGAIDYVDIHRDPQTGKCKGFAFIQYANIEDAKRAVKQMNGIQVYKGHTINVSTVSVLQKGDREVSTGDDYVRSQGSKQALMNSLAREAPSHSNLQRPPISTVSTPYLIMINMFKMEGTSPAFFEELKNSTNEKCKQFGIIEKIFIEKNNQGNVWIKYSDTTSASKCQQKINGQYFDGKKIFCYFVQETTWAKRVGN